MEIDLRPVGWPLSVLRCHEALGRIPPGQALTIRVGDPGVCRNVLLLIRSRPDLRCRRMREPDHWRITVRRGAPRPESSGAGASPAQATRSGAAPGRRRRHTPPKEGRWN
jgi:TusA-related sulfurtransferase